MIVGLGHPRSGTAFTADLLQQSGLDVKHEYLGKDGIVSWEIASLRAEVPWGDGVTSFSAADKVFLVARSPLETLNSVLIENNQIRSIGFRASVIYERFGIDLFSAKNQLTVEPHYDFMSWAVQSLIYWYELCFTHNPEIIFRVDVVSDDLKLSSFLNSEISRVGKNLRRNYKSFHLDNYPVGKLSDQPVERLEKFIELAIRLGYESDAHRIQEMLKG